MRTATFRLAMIALALAVMLAPPLAEYAAAQSQPAAAATQTQVPQPQDNSVNWSGAGYGAGALFCSLLYIPFKLTYAVLGGLIGGGTYLVTAGNTQAANTVWRSSLGGDWVVTPAMLQGQEPLNFSGPTDTPPDATTAQASASSGTSSTTTTANSGSVAPIAPLPASGTAGAAGTSATASSSTAAGGQPMDHGSGPAPAAPSSSNIE